jgi:2-(1,2-epoxy-1,2-dihydrophenyl)acetyl-CoA isomerase
MSEASSKSKGVRCEAQGALAIIELDRPAALNALDADMSREFLAAVRAATSAAATRAVLLCGAGRAFCAGGDVAGMQSSGGGTGVAEELIENLHEAVRLLAAHDAPVIAALQGPVAGAGWSLALAADLAIAADDAVFTLAYARLGASCDVGSSWALPRIVGLRRALQIALLSERIDAATALQWGLVNRLVPAAQLREQALALARQLAEGPTLALGRLKRLMRQSLDTELGPQLDAERDAFVAGTASADFSEGVSAFLAKRAPRFLGR